ERERSERSPGSRSIEHAWASSLRRALGLRPTGYHSGGFVRQGRRCFRRDRGIEQISTARYRLDQAVTVITELAAQLTNDLHDGVIRNDDVGPDRVVKLLLGNKASGSPCEVAKHLKCLGS